MKLSDSLAGLVAALLGAAVVVYARTFPAMPGQRIGPALFPTMIGAGLIATGTALIFTGVRKSRGFQMALDAWVRKPRMMLNFGLVLADLLFYALALEWLGFFITAPLFLAILFVAFGVRRKWVVGLALLVPLVIHYAFYNLLRVPLPWGLLEAIAW